MTKGKIINDPVFGFITLPDGILMDIIRHPLFQRLTRIKQLGLSSFVYPGAQHTRFQHSIGAYHLMSEALETLMRKGTIILDDEAEAAQAAILLHDIGHGPFSHILEHFFVTDLCHEDVSLLIMQRLNREFGGALDKAIRIFTDNYPRRFFHQLICSQLDVDRLEYLCRDSFFTGVREGNIGAARIIKILNVHEDKLVAESKGIYSIENYLTTRRLMYWQVYLHKTAIACEAVLVKALERARYLIREGRQVDMPAALAYFLHKKLDRNEFMASEEHLEHYTELDDYDVWEALKAWRRHDDRILSILARNFVDRIPFRTETAEAEVSPERMEQLRRDIAGALGISPEDTRYFIATHSVEKEMYTTAAEGIRMLYPDGQIRDVTDVSELINSDAADKKTAKQYLLYQRI